YLQWRFLTNEFAFVPRRTNRADPERTHGALLFPLKGNHRARGRPVRASRKEQQMWPRVAGLSRKRGGRLRRTRSERRGPKALRQTIATIWGLFEYICVEHTDILWGPSGVQDAQTGHQRRRLALSDRNARARRGGPARDRDVPCTARAVTRRPRRKAVRGIVSTRARSHDV